ncbi:MAG TPA: SsrA-binding protein SmpB [Candidatus Portnoybacteria bacterium]|jgi:SsrA-binding protein|nr:SsrA-binding protein SmpB [Candidatus Portnoybacteria bacterium]MDD5752001.1 SsrA-binding protein SmpB [Candidatus Portnoybacteria bacterium]HNU96777.1 SsrA-binding protein SmpB [Candidatus Portnoybacteria bacterium]HOZ16195.1 SsrA-binding protein SmpB [Candidatus Portnoybacteria bacterium]HPH52010.1 SsrA-binding protein SmpB [Candidatus Portnoybacteria bacterium]
MKVLTENRKSTYNYEILETYEAGLALYGFEVKAIKTGHISLKGSFVTLKNKELFLTNALIPPYQPKNTPVDYDQSRARKLLLKKSEISTLIGKLKIKGLTLIPIRLYTKKNRIKLEFGIAKGKRKIDKRISIKKRDIERELGRKLKN